MLEDNWNLGRIENGSLDAIASTLDGLFDFSEKERNFNSKLFLDPMTGQVFNLTGTRNKISHEFSKISAEKFQRHGSRVLPCRCFLSCESLRRIASTWRPRLGSVTSSSAGDGDLDEFSFGSWRGSRGVYDSSKLRAPLFISFTCNNECITSSHSHPGQLVYPPISVRFLEVFRCASSFCFGYCCFS